MSKPPRGKAEEEDTPHHCLIILFAPSIMGNESSSEPLASPIVMKPEVKAFARDVSATINRDLDEWGYYHEYRRLRGQRDIACNHPFIAFSQAKQDECSQLQVRTLRANLKAIEATEGVSLLMDWIEK